MRVFLIVAALAATLVPAAAAAPLPTADVPCAPKKKDRKATVLTRSAQAVVHARRGRVFACWRPAGKVWALGRGVPVSDVAGERLAYGAGGTVRLLALPTGEPSDVATAVETGAEISAAKVTDVVLRGDGAIAWIGEARSGGALVRQVRQVGGLLGTGDGIEPTSLELEGDRVAWKQSGIDRSAPLTLPEPVTPARESLRARRTATGR